MELITNSYVFGLLLVLLSTVASVFGLLIVRRRVGLETLASWHDVAGYLLSVVGTMYAVLLGLIVVDAMNKFETARTTVEQEANGLADVFLLAERMPPKQRLRIQDMCLSYASVVIDDEWPAMAHQDVSLPARHMAVRLIKAVQDFEPVTESQKAIYPIIVTESMTIWDNRRARTNAATNGIPAVEWSVVLFGGAVTIIFTYFFGLQSLKSQIVMTSMVAILIGLNIYLIFLFGYPYAGDLKVEPEAFEVDRRIFMRLIG
jgi:hypothetical protein